MAPKDKAKEIIKRLVICFLAIEVLFFAYLAMIKRESASYMYVFWLSIIGTSVMSLGYIIMYLIFSRKLRKIEK